MKAWKWNKKKPIHPKVKKSSTTKAVKKATNKDKGFPSSTQLSQIAQLSYNQKDFKDITHIIWQRIKDHELHRTQKTLILLEYLLANGVQQFREDARSHAHLFQLLAETNLCHTGEDAANEAVVRAKARNIILLLNNDELYNSEREKAAKLSVSSVTNVMKTRKGKTVLTSINGNPQPARNDQPKSTPISPKLDSNPNPTNGSSDDSSDGENVPKATRQAIQPKRFDPVTGKTQFISNSPPPSGPPLYTAAPPPVNPQDFYSPQTQTQQRPANNFFDDNPITQPHSLPPSRPNPFGPDFNQQLQCVSPPIYQQTPQQQPNPFVQQQYQQQQPQPQHTGSALDDLMQLTIPQQQQPKPSPDDLYIGPAITTMGEPYHNQYY
ncbi:hypothetical protein TRFO_18980 [Tritrichomonas foetus]|uniref:ENTH domain-containing protein n=1 Tax=Tritrichomonas foetus TaxID=1144522 RepID=A0A1J4KQ27_9EUKA|nr:hypothetical protein TRFO_18980 [Tritrichomonas foetus]|eukprot:OHT11533.1 hypothetical protein TRFO_18980 [Tritrichomonas foetus]